MKPITTRAILEARAVLMREIEAGRVKKPLSNDEVEREVKQRGRLKIKPWHKEHPKPSRSPMFPGEIPLKQYIDDRAAKEGISSHAMFNRLNRSNYAGVPIRRVNARVIFVQMEPQNEREEITL